MTSCDYCYRNAMYACADCPALCCEEHSAEGPEAQVQCNPDPATWPGRGCSKPPVAEVACVACGKPTSELHADVPIHVECRPRAPCTTHNACLRADRCLGVCS